MYKFIDLFAGIGGFHIALSNLGMNCVLSSEIDKYAKKTYLHNLETPIMIGDITLLDSVDIPNFDILCAGFPCQPFSQAGLKNGFNDTRGTLFFEIIRILKDKQPKAFILENVRGILKHDNGNTFNVIKDSLVSLGYTFDYKLIKATDFNCPQHRPRVYMVGFKKELIKDKDFCFVFPKPVILTKTMSDILGGKCSRDIGFTLRVGGRGSPINDRRNWDGYIVDDKEVRLTPDTAKLMQGFTGDYHFPVSNQQAMKQIGNSVAIPVVQAIGKEIHKTLDYFLNSNKR